MKKMMTVSSTNKPLVPIDEFCKIIQLLNIPHDFNYLEKERGNLDEVFKNFAPPNIDKLIDDLTNILIEYEVAPFENALIRMFLGHCNNLGIYASWQQYPNLVEDYIEEATKCFQEALTFKPWLKENAAFLYWYNGLLYYNRQDFNSCYTNLLEADNILSELQSDYRSRGPSGKCNDVRDLREKHLRKWIKQTSPNITPHYVSVPEGEENKRSRPGVIGKAFQRFVHPRVPEHNVSPSDEKKPDRPPKSPSAPEPTEYSSTFLKNSSFNLHAKSQFRGRQEISQKHISRNESPKFQHIVIPVDIRALDDPCLDSSPLNLNLFDKLQKYHRQKTNGSQPNRIIVPGIATGVKNTRIIPSLPIYGSATAGLNGEAVFQSPVGFAGSVDENFQVQIGRNAYFVYSTKRNDPQIALNNIIGWLKIEGNSMTGAEPISIKDQDYVLFNENRDYRALLDKIVIASLSDEIPPFRLIVKYLVKDGGKFFLRSVSLSQDYPDIEIIRNYQVVGEVIAIAKPI